MARPKGAARVKNTIGANPYPAPKQVLPNQYHCEVCDRNIFARDWLAHKGGKSHHAAEVRAGEAKDPCAYPSVEKEMEDAEDFNSAWKASHKGNGDFEGGARESHMRGCYYCGDDDHFKRDCPKAPAGVSGDGDDRACFKCGQSGHVKRDCPDNNEACFNCGGEGHRKAECPIRAVREDDGQGPQCYNCYEFGHFKGDCPNERVMKCRNCDGLGHHARDCPEPTNMANVKCYNCDKYGHFSSKCSEPQKQSTSSVGASFDNEFVVGSGWDVDDNSGTAGTAGTTNWDDNGASGSGTGNWNNDADNNDWGNATAEF